ncbi:MAG: hypothetical protein WCA19_07160 [Candidatus Acidiferrales bacterium]
MKTKKKMVETLPPMFPQPENDEGLIPEIRQDKEYRFPTCEVISNDGDMAVLRAQDGSEKTYTRAEITIDPDAFLLALPKGKVLLERELEEAVAIEHLWFLVREDLGCASLFDMLMSILIHEYPDAINDQVEATVSKLNEELTDKALRPGAN